MENKGIINSGDFKAGNVATGDGASITVTNNNSQDLQQLSVLLDQLLSQLHSTPEKIDNKAEIVNAVTTLKEEAKKPSPGKLTLKSIAGTVLDNLKYVKDLAPIAESIYHHIIALVAH